MKPTYDIIPKVAVHPTCINIYNEIAWYPYKPGKFKNNIVADSPEIFPENVNPETGEILLQAQNEIKSPAAHLLTSDKKYHGIVSGQTRRKMSKAVDYLLYLANDKALPATAHGKSYNFKIAFITLTLPSAQIHSDDEIKEQCLNQFLVELRKRHQVKNYLWRAEKQKNGNIHFHILCDRFIPWSEIRDRWNRICNKLGYVERYRNEMKAFHSSGFQVRKDLLKKWEYKAQIKAYQTGKANDWNNPNSTDVHSLYRVSRVREYIAKYTTKDDKNAEVEGRIWGCNYELSHITGGVTELDSLLKSELNEVIDKFKPRVYTADYFSVIHIDVNQLRIFGDSLLYRLFTAYLSDHFSIDIVRELSLN